MITSSEIVITVFYFTVSRRTVIRTLTNLFTMLLKGNLVGISLTPSDITRSHRLGTPKPSRNTRSTKVNPRPIIFQFANFRMRQEVFYSKGKLKGKNISISESLTLSRYKLLREAQAKLGNGKVWTTEGRVTTKINDRIVTINSIDDLQRC